MNLWNNIKFAGVVLVVSGISGPAFGADIEAGKLQFQKCATCHSLEEGKNRIGPSLFGVLKRSPGSLTGYRYSQAMTAFGADGKVWTEALLMDYLKSPRTIVPGTKMGFPGMPGKADRENLIAYLKSAGGQ